MSPTFIWRPPEPFFNPFAKGIGWCPWISRMPPFRFRFIHLLVGTLRGGFGLPVPCSLFWPFDGSSGLYPYHGPRLRDHASSWLPDPPVSRRLAGPGFHLPGDCTGEGFSSLALPASWDSRQSPQELFDSQADSGLPRDYDSDCSFEGFPDPQADPEVVPSPSGISVHPVSSSVLLETTVGDHVFNVSSGFRLQAADACISNSSQCGQSSPAQRFPGGVGFRLPSGSFVVVRRLSSSSWHASRRVSPRPVFVHRRIGHRLGRLSRAMSICQAHGLTSPLGFPSITESFWQFCWLFGDSFLLFVVVWWRCSPTTPPPLCVCVCVCVTRSRLKFHNKRDAIIIFIIILP